MKNQMQKEVEDFSSFLKLKKCDSIALIFLDVLFPFKRLVLFVFAVSNPLLSLIFGLKTGKKLGKFCEDESWIELLKEDLEKGRT